MRTRATRGFWSQGLLALLALVMSALWLGAYVPMRWAPNGVRGAWQPSRFPLAFYLNETATKGLANVASGSNPFAAARAAMTSWQSIQTSQIRFADLKLIASESALDDGMNLITLADTPVNREILGGPAGAVALTRIVFNANTGEITESDILVNPGYRFSTNLAPRTYDLQTILTHELGHALGCDHSAALNDTMFPVTATGEFFQRNLSADAIAFASFTYPNPSRVDSLGAITGRITSAGGGIFGAAVIAQNLDHNLIYTAFSESDGRYAINGPIAGRYAVYAEPLDGPATPDQLMVQGSNAYYRGLNTSFRTAFVKEQNLGVGGYSKKLELDLAVPAGVPTLNIDRLGQGDPESGIGYLSAGAVVASPGEALNLWIGGANTWKVSGIGDVSIWGDGVTLDIARGVRKLKNGSGAEVGISVLVQVAADAAPGARTIVLKVGDQQVASTGGIVVAPRALPAATLYLPYLKANPDQYTGLALANPDPSISAVVRLSGRNANGDLLWSEDALIPADRTVAGGRQQALLDRQIFNLPLDARESGSMAVESDSSNLHGFFLTGDFAGTYLDGAEAFTRGYRQLYFVDVLQNASTATEIHLMNTKDVPVVVDLLLVDSSLAISRPVQRTIPAGGKIGESVSSLFGYSGELRSAHVRATAGDDALAGFGLVSQLRAVLGLNAIAVENAGPVLYSPQLAVGDLGLHFETRLNVVNIGDARATVTVALLDEDGQTLGPGTKSMDLVPGAHFCLDVSSLFGIERGQGYIRVSTASGGKLIGNVMFGDGDPTRSSLEFGAALPLFASGAQGFLFAHIAQGSGYYTGVAFLAPDGARLTMEAFNGDGAYKGGIVRDLSPGQRLVSLLKGLLPETDGQIGGYVKVTSDRPLMGFELFGTSDGKVLSAVPPQRLAK
jgi:hypothetical protein